MSQKFYQGLVSHELIGYFFTFDLLSTQFIMAILSRECKPDNFQSHNSLTLSFMNIRGICSNFTEYESFLESNSPEILALCETNLYDSIDSANFSVRDYLPLMKKDSAAHMHGLAAYVKEGLLFAWYLSLWKTLRILNYVFNWLYFTQFLTSFSSTNHLLCHYARFLMLFPLT